MLIRPGFSARDHVVGRETLTVSLAPAANSKADTPPEIAPVASPQVAPELPAEVSAPPAAAEADPAPSTLVTPPEQDRYLLNAEVDVRARPIYLEPLIYPEQAFRSKIGGRLKLRVYINAAGGIDAVDVLESDPPGVFEAAALKALLASKFLPAMIAGKNVRSQKLLEIDLDPYENLSKAAP